MPIDSTDDPTVSVCMATYNGSRFVRQQLISILAEVGQRDEVIVVDDCSSDDTVSAVLSMNDPRIRVERNDTNRGHVASFERAISMAKGDYILLADQDDVWAPGRVSAMLEALRSADIVAGNLIPLDGESFPPTRLRGQDSERAWRNLVGIFLGRRSYFGSAMGFRRTLVDALLPFPPNVEAHDLWMAILGSAGRGWRLKHLETAVVLRRVHEENLTPRTRRPLRAVLRTRGRFLSHVAVARWRPRRP